MNSSPSINAAVEGSHTVFAVTNYWEKMSKDVEVGQGKAIADAAKAAGVQHLIWSSLVNVTEVSGGRLPNVPHFDGKNDVEKYIRQIGVPATFVYPGYFMSNLKTTLAKVSFLRL